MYNIKEKCFNKYFYLTVMEKKDKLYIGLYNDITELCLRITSASWWICITTAICRWAK